MINSLLKVLDKTEEAIARTRGRSRIGEMLRCLESCHLLVIIGSGNSTYPATYLNYLLRKSSTFTSLLLSPLEYALSPPLVPHVCMLFSQGARRSDSLAIENICELKDVPLFLVCDEQALEKDTVASRLVERYGRERVFPTFTGRERAFLNVVGTTAAFVPSHEIAVALGAELPGQLPGIDWIQAKTIALDHVLPYNERLFILHGPAGRPAAEAFAGYHQESMGPVGVCEINAFRHGVWRGLKEVGAHTVLFVGEKNVTKLADYICERICGDHRCVRIDSASSSHWTIEPLDLYVRMLYVWAYRCASYAETHPGWYPLFAEMTRYESYKGITEGFDISRMVRKEE